MLLRALLRSSRCRRCLDAAKRGFASTSSQEQADVLIVGAGHNGLVAATLLARQGLKVRPAVTVACTRLPARF